MPQTFNEFLQTESDINRNEALMRHYRSLNPSSNERCLGTMAVAASQMTSLTSRVMAINAPPSIPPDTFQNFVAMHNTDALSELHDETLRFVENADDEIDDNENRMATISMERTRMYTRMFRMAYNIESVESELRYQIYFSRRAQKYVPPRCKWNSLTSRNYKKGQVGMKTMKKLAKMPQTDSFDEFLATFLSLTEKHDDLEHFRGLVCLTDIAVIPLDPLLWYAAVFPITSQHRDDHRALARTMDTIMRYCRWLNSLDLFIDTIDTHSGTVQWMKNMAMAIKQHENQPGAQQTYELSILELQAIKHMRAAVWAIKCGLKNRAMAELKETKKLKMQIFEIIETVVQDEGAKMKGTNFNDGRSDVEVVEGENAYLQYGEQMKRVTDKLESLIHEGESYGHYALRKSYASLKPLRMSVDKTMWRTIASSPTIVNTRVGQFY